MEHSSKGCVLEFFILSVVAPIYVMNPFAIFDHGVRFDWEGVAPLSNKSGVVSEVVGFSI